MARLVVTEGPGPIESNEEGPPGRYVCLSCDFDASTYGRVEKHADREHPTKATRIEWRP